MGMLWCGVADGAETEKEGVIYIAGGCWDGARGRGWVGATTPPSSAMDMSDTRRVLGTKLAPRTEGMWAPTCAASSTLRTHSSCSHAQSLSAPHATLEISEIGHVHIDPMRDVCSLQQSAE